MKIEMVTVSVGYGDFLWETARVNRPLVDDMVVITSCDDRETQSVCKELSIRYVMSDDHKRGGAFNKARLVNRVLDQIGAQDWVLHLDADIVLPRSFRRFLDWADLDETCIYGADRCNLVGYCAWCKIRDAGGWDNHRYGCMQCFAQGAKMGGRHIPQQHGYVPIGFFQLFHGSELLNKGYHCRRYPIHHGDAARTDVQFALQWDRRHRELLPEVITLHLESEAAHNGANWNGRTTKQFGPGVNHGNPCHHHKPVSW